MMAATAAKLVVPILLLANIPSYCLANEEYVTVSEIHIQFL